jgi:FMN phosphatase YigB (HAD superfamily)
MIVVFDLDDTIFRTYKIKAMMERVLRDQFRIENFQELYEEYREHSSEDIFTFEKFSQFLLVKTGVQHESSNILRVLQQEFQEDQSYLVEGVREHILKLRDEGTTVILLTWGDEEFQREKLRRVGLELLFHEMIFTDTSAEKIEKIREIMRENPGEQIIIYNDKEEENAEFRAIGEGRVEVCDVRLRDGISFEESIVNLPQGFER